jgi:hypothetical protein
MHHHLMKRVNGPSPGPLVRQDSKAFANEVLSPKNKTYWKTPSTPQEETRLKQLTESVLTDYSCDMFEIATVTRAPIVFVGMTIAQHHKIFETFSLKEEIWANFLREVNKGYKSNLYHNAIHGADVAQTLNTFILNGLEQLAELDSVDIFACLVAALCHDFKHPGVNNLYLKNVQDDLAITYNDISPLEMMHVAEVYRLMRSNKSCNVFSTMKPVQSSQARFAIVQMVLGTDMNNHFTDLAGFKANCLFDHGDEAQTHTLKIQKMKMALHVSDMSNPTKRNDICVQWADCILAEFFDQGDKELTQGLEISPMCNREEVNRPKSQIGNWRSVFMLAVLLSNSSSLLCRLH